MPPSKWTQHCCSPGPRTIKRVPAAAMGRRGAIQWCGQAPICTSKRRRRLSRVERSSNSRGGCGTEGVPSRKPPTTDRAVGRVVMPRQNQARPRRLIATCWTTGRSKAQRLQRQQLAINHHRLRVVTSSFGKKAVRRALAERNDGSAFYSLVT